MERVIVFLDYANINSTGPSMNVDFDDLLHYLSEDRFLIDAYAYVPIDPRNEHGRDREIARLWEAGYQVTNKLGTVLGESYKCDFDVEITIDLLRSAYQIRPDIITLCSGDVKFLPIVHELRRMGIRVESAAFLRNASHKLMTQSSGFINLDEWITSSEIDGVESSIETRVESPHDQPVFLPQIENTFPTLAR